MDAVLILDGDGASSLSDDFGVRLLALLAEKGYRSETVTLWRREVAPCRGCLLCLTKHPGRCVVRDVVAELKWRMHCNPGSGVTVFITPVRFGHFSSVIKNAVDRGVGSHVLQVFLGYGVDIDDEEKRTFIDLIARHRGSADIVHPGMDGEVLVFVATCVEDNAAICESLRARL